MSKAILITGASGHVGSGMARYFSEQGYRLILAGRDNERLQRASEASSGEVQSITLDLNDRESIAAAVNAIGEVDWLINNAADVTSLPLMDSSPDMIARQVDANVTGTIVLTRALLPTLLSSGSGAIVNVSSLAGYKANPSQTVYSVTKSAMNAFSEALRMELREKNIAIVNVALASVCAGEGPERGKVTTTEVAQAIERAVARGQSEVYFSPITRMLMKLYGAFPGLRLLRPPHVD